MRCTYQEQRTQGSIAAFPVKSCQWLKNWYSCICPVRRMALQDHGVSVLWLGDNASLICIVCLSVAACESFWANVSLRYALHVAGILSSQEITRKFLIFASFRDLPLQAEERERKTICFSQPEWGGSNHVFVMEFVILVYTCSLYWSCFLWPLGFLSAHPLFLNHFSKEW